MADKKSVQLAEIKDENAKVKKITSLMLDEVSDLKKLVDIEFMDTNAPYLAALGDVVKGVEKDVTEITNVIKKLFRTLEQDAEETVRIASKF